MKTILILDKIFNVLIITLSIIAVLPGLSLVSATPDWFDFRMLGWLLIAGILIVVLPVWFIKNKILKLAIKQNSIQFGLLATLLQFSVFTALVSIIAIFKFNT